MFKRVPVIEFAVIQEKWIKDVIKPHDFEQVMSKDEANLLCRIGCEHYQCRIAAQKEFRSREFDSRLRMAIWGGYAKNWDVKVFCRSTLDNYYLCDLCQGTRRCVFCFVNYQYIQSNCRACKTSGDCPRCGGIGNFSYIYEDRWLRGVNSPLKLRDLFRNPGYGVEEAAKHGFYLE
jgi:hypothetical protein